MRSLPVLLLCLLPGLAFAQNRPFSSSGWFDGAPNLRPAPNTRYVEPCTEIGCRGDLWLALLTERKEPTALAAPAGGRAYRYFIDRYDFGLGLKIVRLEVAADGGGTLTWSYPNAAARSRPVPADVVANFENALKASRFEAAEQQAAPACATAGDEVVFEGVVAGRYKLLVEPCGGEAGLTRALEILDAQT